MTSIATPGQVSTLLGRTFTPAEAAQCQGFLDEIHEEILERIPDLEAKIAAGTIKSSTVGRVERRAARRVMLNPEALLEERIDDYTGRRDSAISSGEVYITDDEWYWLIPASAPGDSFTIAMGNAGPRISDGRRR